MKKSPLFIACLLFFCVVGRSQYGNPLKFKVRMQAFVSHDPSDLIEAYTTGDSARMVEAFGENATMEITIDTLRKTIVMARPGLEVITLTEPVKYYTWWVGSQPVIKLEGITSSDVSETVTVIRLIMPKKKELRLQEPVKIYVDSYTKIPGLKTMHSTTIYTTF